MTYMKTVIDGFEAAGRTEIKMAIGGAPISQMFADEIGADGYAADASSAVDLFHRLAGKGGGGPDLPAPTLATAPVAAVAPVAARDPNAKSKYQILYWQDLPSQVKAWDDFEERKFDLPSPFPDRIDAKAQRLGLTQGDDYLAQLRWGDALEQTGPPAEVIKAICQQLGADTPHS
jgi:hypothetical protein